MNETARDVGRSSNPMIAIIGILDAVKDETLALGKAGPGELGLASYLRRHRMMVDPPPLHDLDCLDTNTEQFCSCSWTTKRRYNTSSPCWDEHYVCTQPIGGCSSGFSNAAIQFVSSVDAVFRVMSVNLCRANTNVTTYQDRNIILANTHEYRFPSSSAIQVAAERAPTTSEPDTTKIKVDMTSRLIGLVVVPGQHITKIELEENPHEMRAQRREGIV